MSFSFPEFLKLLCDHSSVRRIILDYTTSPVLFIGSVFKSVYLLKYGQTFMNLLTNCMPVYLENLNISWMDLIYRKAASPIFFPDRISKL